MATLLIVVISSMIFVACAPAPAPAPKPAPAPAPAPAPTPAAAPKPAPAPAPAAPAAAPQVTTWRATTQIPPSGWGVVHGYNPMFEKLDKATNGKIKGQVYPAQSLAKGTDEWQACKSGISQMAMAVHGFWPGMTPLADVVSLPFMPFKSGEQASGILWQLYEKFPNLAGQFKENKILALWCSDPYFLITTKKQVKTMEDMKGMKLRFLGGPPTEQAKLLGVAPMMLPMGDTYINLQKGVMEGMPTCWEALTSFRQYEVVKYYTFGAPFHLAYFSLPLNLDAWNSMTPDLQNTVMKTIGGLEGSKFWGRVWDSAGPYVREEVKKGKFEMVEHTIPPAELQNWVNVAGKPVWEDWVKKMEAAGYKEAREILNTTLELSRTWNP